MSRQTENWRKGNMTISEFKDKIAEVERFYSKDYVNEQKNELYKYFKE